MENDRTATFLEKSLLTCKQYHRTFHLTERRQERDLVRTKLNITNGRADNGTELTGRNS